MRSTHYRYGNRTAQTATAGSGPSNSVTVDPTTNRITSMGSSTFVYDASGNLTQDDLYKYVYDAENCLVQVQTLTGSVVASYAIDGHRLRVAKVVGTNRTFYLYSGTKVISEFSDTASTTYTTGTTPKQAPADSASLLLYHHSDHLTPRLATDNSGNIASTHGHYPFGESWYDTGPASSTVARKFTTYMQDTETSTGQLHYAKFREHSARLGRFYMADPVERRRSPQNLNRYSYVANDPLNHGDPLGLQFEGENPLGICSGFPSEDPFTLSQRAFSEGLSIGDIQIDLGADMKREACRAGIADLLDVFLDVLPNLRALKDALRKFSSPFAGAELTGTLMDCGICCDQANAAHGLICTGLLLAEFGLAAELCFTYSEHWAGECAKACVKKHPTLPGAAPTLGYLSLAGVPDLSGSSLGASAAAGVAAGSPRF